MNKILIVEDTSMLQHRLENILNKTGVGVTETINTANFVKSISKNYCDEFSLFVVDLDTVKYNGTEMIKLIRHEMTNKEIPVIAMSQHGNVSMFKKAVVAGCNDFIIKPFASNVLSYKVKKLLGQEITDEISPNNFQLSEASTDGATHLLWEQDFKIGEENIDSEHKEIIEKYEQLYRLMKDGHGHEYYNELLSFLNDYVHRHFNHEEQIHIAYNYPLRDEHIKIHGEFKESVLRMYNDGIKSDVTSTDLIKMSLFIRNWWVHHILIEDQKFGDFINESSEE